MPRRILLVDDNVDLVTTLAFLFKTWGHEVRMAHDGFAALEVAAVFRPDVVFLDVALPRLNGLEVARRLRTLPDFAKTLLIGQSGYGTEKDRRRAQEAGIDLYLVKPFDPWRLEGVLASRGTVRAASA